MNTFDRYIIRSFLKNYVLSCIVLIGLYVLLDAVLKFDELTRGDGNATRSGLLGALALIANIADYYFYQSFYFFVQLAGIIPVAAAAFTLFRMTRSNELTAMLAAGVPLLRIAAPIMLVGVLLNGILVVDQEILIPAMVNKLARETQDVSRETTASFPIRFMQDEAGSLLTAASYTPPRRPGEPAVVDRLDVVERNAQYDPVAHIEAKRAVYDDGAGVWRLEEASRTTGLRPEEPLVVDRAVREWRTSITPTEIMIYRRHRTSELLSSGQINELLERPRSYGVVPLLRVKHWRVAQPIANTVLLLLAIPCVLMRDPGSLRWAATRAVLLTGFCLASMFIAHQMAGTPRGAMNPNHWILLMLWLPIVIFGPVAVVLLDRVKS